MIKLLTYFCLAMIIAGCGSQRSPREVTIEFVGAVIEDDSLAIENVLDLDSMVKRRMQEVPPTDSSQTPEYFRNKILGTLIGDGGTRAYWKSMTAIVNKENVVRDTAEVELTFLDKNNAKIHYLLVYLYKSESGWRIFYFL